LLLSVRYCGLTDYIRACFTAYGKTLHTEFTKNSLTETYFCNKKKKQHQSKMAEGVFLNSGMQRLTISEGPRAFEQQVEGAGAQA
jgi:hypothetical protein